jgi:hypothetical protein
MKLRQYVFAYAVGAVPVFIWVMFLLVWPSDSQAPKDSLSPKLYQQMRSQDPLSEIHNQLGTIQFQHSAMLQKLAVLEQHLVDLDHRVDIHRQEIDAESPLKERVTKLEDFVTDHNRAEERTLQANERVSARLYSLTQACVMFLLGIVAIEVRKWYSNRKRHELADAKMDRLMDQTNGVAEKLLNVSVKAAHAEGVIEGHEG